MATEIKIKAAIVGDANDLGYITIDGKTLAELGATINGKVITLAGYGTFDVTTAKNLLFTAEAGLPAGEYTFVDLVTDGIFTKIDLSKTTNAITVTGPSNKETKLIGGSGDNKLIGAVAATTIVGGAGNDTLSGIGASELTGGKGADTFDVIATNIVKDYDYSQGDILKGATGVVKGVTKAGVIDGTLGASSTIVATDNVYKIKFNDTTLNTTTEYWTANTSVTGVKVDASAVTNSVKITGTNDKDILVGGTGRDTITAAAFKADVWGGAGADAITVTTNTDSTVWFGKGDGLDSVTGFVGGVGATNNTVYLYDTASLNDVKFAGTAAKTTMLIGSDRLELTGLDAKSGKGKNTKVKLADGTVKTVAFGTDTAAQTIAADAATVGAVDYVVAATAKSTAEYTANTTKDTKINLQDTEAFKNIANVTAAAATGNLTIIGLETASNIVLGKGNDAVWGGGAGSDTIDATAGGKNTIWYGGSYDGTDKVTGFTKANDTVYFWDMGINDVVKKAEFSATATDTSVKIKFDDKNSLDLDIKTGAAATHTIQVKGASDTAVSKLQYNADAKTAAALFAADAKYYVNGTKDGIMKFTAVSKADVYLDNINYNDPNWDVYAKGYTDLDATGATGDYKLVGSGSQANKITGGAGTTAMWGGGSSFDTFTGGTGIDTVWFGKGDGFDTFDNAGVEDTVLFWSETSISDLTATYDGDQLLIATKTGDQLLVSMGAGQELGAMTFQVGPNAEGGKYSFNKETKQFVAK